MTIFEEIMYVLNEKEYKSIKDAKEVCFKIIKSLEKQKDTIGQDFINLLELTYKGLDEILDYDDGAFSIEREVM